MSISGVYALTTQNTSGVLSTGFVDVKLQTYELNSENEEVEFSEKKKLLPGETISFIPKVINLGANCYIRIKINYNSLDFSEYVTGFSSNFEKYGDYYYYKNILNTDETLVLFNTITIPPNADTLAEDKNLKFEITVEAMQDKNFAPDYSIEDPWNGIVPTDNDTASYDIDNEKDLNITIKYENGTEKDISIPNNFLEALKDAMPGDSFTEKIEIKNITKDKVKYFLKLDLNNLNTDEIELLNNLNLEITNEKGKVLYNNKLLINNNAIIAELEKNESSKLEFKITVPKELPNKYSNLNPKLSLTFSSDYKEKTNTNSGTIENSSNTNLQNKGITKLVTNPKTGDKVFFAMIIFIISAICFVVTIVLDFIIRKKENI